jgi:hypothetical protein
MGKVSTVVGETSPGFRVPDYEDRHPDSGCLAFKRELPKLKTNRSKQQIGAAYPRLGIFATTLSHLGSDRSRRKRVLKASRCIRADGKAGVASPPRGPV